MGIGGMTRTLLRGSARALRLLARPVHAVAGSGGVVLQPYRGYGSRDEVFLIGRVFRQPTPASGSALASVREETLPQAVVDIGRRVMRRGIAGAVVLARFGSAEERVVSDRDGYFRVHLRPSPPPRADRLWHEMELELVSPVRLRTEADIFIPPASCRYVVISDIDDTVMETGVASKAVMLYRLFLQGSQSRIAFPGMAALLRALHHGVSGAEHNPMLYVSRAPWSIYEVLDEFFNLHAIPVGPLLFLREWGLTLQSPLPRRGKGHKLELIRNMLALYDGLPFLLIGDSGQRDPEIYAKVVHENPGRVLAIYIRNVSPEPERQQAIQELAAEVVKAGSSLLLAADSLAMARHAVEHGFVAPAALAEVEGERAEQAAGPAAPTDHVDQPDATAAAACGRRGDMAPHNVVIEPDDARRLQAPSPGPMPASTPPRTPAR